MSGSSFQGVLCGPVELVLKVLMEDADYIAHLPVNLATQQNVISSAELSLCLVHSLRDSPQESLVYVLIALGMKHESNICLIKWVR